MGGGGVQTHFRVKPNSVEVVLGLSWGCGKINVPAEHVEQKKFQRGGG